MDTNIQLLFHILPILIGLSFAYTPILDRYSLSKRDKLLWGLIFVILGGFTVSTHTWWFHNKFMEMGGDVGCSAFGAFSCGDVLANTDYNTVPLIGIPWGLAGMFGFAGMAYVALSVRKEPHASWVEMHLKGGMFLSGGGVLIALYLMYVEIFPLEMHFCQYCTIAHVADLFAALIFFQLLKLYQEGVWDPEKEEVELKKSERKNKRKKGGFVKPIKESELKKDLESKGGDQVELFEEKLED